MYEIFIKIDYTTYQGVLFFGLVFDEESYYIY